MAELPLQAPHLNKGNSEDTKLGKLLNVFYAAALDLKTYSVTKIDVFGQVTELQKSLGIIAEYIEMARAEISE